MKWTSNQQKAIETIGTNILVSASAGAGKTTILVERLMKRILVDRIDVSSILALTFTEAAAAEMKHRLQAVMNQRLQTSFDPFLQEQISLLETAHISTIHSFCLSIVQNYGYVLSLDPKQVSNLLDEASKSIMIQEVLEDVISAQLQQPTDEFYALTMHFDPRSESFETLKQAIFAIYRAAWSQPDTDAWFDQVLLLYQPASTIQQMPEVFQHFVWQSLRLVAHQILDILKQLEKQVQYFIDDSAILSAIGLRSALIHQALSACNQKDYDGYYHAITRSAEIKLKAVSSDENYTTLRKSLASLVSSCVERSFLESQLLQDIHHQLPLIQALIDLATDFGLKFALKKKEQSCIDFDDMEKFAFDILYHPTHRIDLVYQQMFKEIMVDEFQDTNLIQNAIIERVSSKNNVFRVGDVKQSIYKFRGAKPQLMRTMSMQKDMMQIHLSNNYRSKAPIVEFNNHLFNLWMNLHETEDAYTDFDKVSTGRPEQEEHGIPVSLDLLRGDILNDASDEETMLEESINESIVKARHIAKTILELVEHENHKFSDMVVLVRSHALKSSCKDAFEEANIPYFIDTKSGFYQSDAIQYILNVLRWVANPKHEIAFVGTLQSPLFALSADDVALLQLERRELKRSWNQILSERYPSIYETLQLWSKKFTSQPLHASINEIIQFNDLYERYCNHQDKTNVDFLLEKAHHYDQHQGHGLLGFIAMIEQVKDEKSSEAIPVSSNENVVKVMTIHQSKGLQFPVVFFWSNNTQSILDKRNPCVVDEHLGIGLHTIQLPHRMKRINLIREAIEYKITKEELEEQLRILYVALTRAQNRMYLVGFSKKDHAATPISFTSFFKGIGTYGWLVSALHQFPNQSFVIRNLPLVQAIKPYRKAPVLTDQKLDYILPLMPPEIIESPRYSRRQPGPLILDGSLQANQLGSYLHLAIERLPQVPWNESLVHETKVPLTQHQVEQLIRFSTHPFTQELYNYPMEHELAYHIRKEQQIESGFMDLVIQKDHEVILVDFKSDRNTSPNSLIERHVEQLQRYHHVLSEVFPSVKIQCYIYSFFLNDYVFIPLN